MEKNLTKGEMWFRVLMGFLVIAAVYMPAYTRWMLFVLAGIMILSGLFRYCPLTHLVDKR